MSQDDICQTGIPRLGGMAFLSNIQNIFSNKGYTYR